MKVIERYTVDLDIVTTEMSFMLLLSNSNIITWLVLVWIVSIVSSLILSKLILPFWTSDELTSESLRAAKKLVNATSNGIGSVLLILSIPLIGIEGGLTMLDLSVGWIILTVLHYSGTHYMSRDFQEQVEV